jgi:hypothetical protein
MKFRLSNGIPTPNEPENPITSADAVQQLRRMRGGVPRFVQLQKAQVKSMNRAAALDPQFLEAAFAAISDSAVLRDAVVATDEQLRTQRQDTAQWQSVIEEVDAFRQGVSSTVKMQQHQLATTALHAYAVARNLIRNGQHADLVPHVEKMRSLLRFGKRKPDPAAKPQPPKV